MISASTFLGVAIFSGVILILVLMLNLAESKLLLKVRLLSTSMEMMINH